MCSHLKLQKVSAIANFYQQTLLPVHRNSMARHLLLISKECAMLNRKTFEYLLIFQKKFLHLSFRFPPSCVCLITKSMFWQVFFFFGLFNFIIFCSVGYHAVLLVSPEKNNIRRLKSKLSTENKKNFMEQV